MFFAFALEQAFAHSLAIGEVLQLAVGVSLANLAFHWVIVKDEFNNVATSFAYLWRIGLDSHAILHFVRTRGYKFVRAFNLNNAYPTRALD